MAVSFRWRALLAALTVSAAGTSPALAQTVTIGVSVSGTGPAASLGGPQQNTINLLPDTLGGFPVRYILLSDASDPTQAATNARRLVESDKVDAIIGSSTVPTSLAIAEVAQTTGTPQIALAPFTPRQLEWVFPLPQSVAVMAEPIIEHMKANNLKTLGFIGFSDAYGESWLQEMNRLAEANDIKMVAAERFARTDQSVTAQTLKLMQARPDAVLIAGSGTPAALPMIALRERGFRGQVYQTHGVANNEFLRVAGRAHAGLVLPTGNVLVAELLDDSHPSKAPGLAYVQAYEAKHGEGSRSPFGAYAQDAYLVLDDAVARAAKVTQPGQPGFKQALRDALEQSDNVPVTHGVVTMSPTDHSGMGENSRVLITVEDGRWVLVP